MGHLEAEIVRQHPDGAVEVRDPQDPSIHRFYNFYRSPAQLTKLINDPKVEPFVYDLLDQWFTTSDSRLRMPWWRNHDYRQDRPLHQLRAYIDLRQRGVI